MATQFLLIVILLCTTIPFNAACHSLCACFSDHTNHHHHEDEAKSSQVDNAVKKVADVVTEHSHGTELHTWIGVALVIGFIFMLLVDQLSGGVHHHTPVGRHVVDCISTGSP